MRLSILSISSLVIFFTILQNGVNSQQCFADQQDGAEMGIQSVKKGDKINLYRGQQAFAMSMLRTMNKGTPNENIFFSPYSTYHALLLAYFGSTNSTEKELAKALHLDWAENKLKVYQAYRTEKRIRSLRQDDIEFASVDKIFLNQNIPFRDCMKNLFIDELENMNFNEKPEECRKQINNWVENVTRNEIQDFLRQGDVSSETNVVLANAAYFKGQWDIKFNKTNTKMEVFHLTADQTKFVQMMNNKGTYYLGVSEELGCHILDLPYKGGKQNAISMLILLPPMVNGGNSLEKVLDNLTPETLTAAINDFESREIKVGLPTFTFEQRTELVPVLNDIGIQEVFSNKANLKGFADTNLALGDATHLAKIKVDEEGSTAAAATALFSFRSARPLETTEFICNHPFLFLIYDHRSQAILFSGIYRNP